MTSSGVLGEGLQLERTGLAWRRTGLALAVLGCVLGKVVHVAIGAGWVLSAAGALAGCVLVASFGVRRLRSASLTIVRGGRLPSAALPAGLLSAAVVVLGLAIAAVALARAATSM